MFLNKTAVTGLLATILVGAGSVPAQVASFGGDKINFPSGYAKDVLYLTVDRPDLKQFRELYASSAAVEAAKKGQPMPDGTVLTLVQYKALAADGNPEKDGGGRLIKTGEIVAYAVMEKRAGLGTMIPENIRNGTWEYQSFKPDKTVNEKANLKGCYECHQDKVGAKKDWLFSYEAMATMK